MSAVPSTVSHPTRAVIFVLLAWIDLRAAVFLSEARHSAPVAQTPLSIASDPDNRASIAVLPLARIARDLVVPARSSTRHVKPTLESAVATASIDEAQFASIAPSSTDTDSGAVSSDGPVGLPTSQHSTDRFAGSAWMLSRANGVGASLANGGQLGGSQAGLRIFYQTGFPILALTGRASTPLTTRLGREATLGVALRGRGFGIIAEQRFALDRGGRTAPSFTAYGGVSEVGLGHGFRFDGYVQAGAVGLHDIAGFVDGAARIEHTLIENGASRLSGGVGVSGGAQPDVRRIDIGPHMVARVPIGTTPVRVSAEWRQRIAGNASPGSGPAVTLGVDF